MSYTKDNWIDFYNEAQKRQKEHLEKNYEKKLINDLRSFVDENEIQLHNLNDIYQHMKSINSLFDNYILLNSKDLDVILYDCKILILTANPVEKAILHHFVLKHGNSQISKIIYNEESYFVFKLGSYWICHVAQSQTGSYKDHGTYSTIQKALNHFTPNVIFALGVAFGIDYKTQHIGDVLVSKRLLPYSENKRIDGYIKPDRNQDKKISNWLEVRLNSPGFLDNVTYGDILSGESVISSVDEKDKICLAYSENEFIIGGEMEGNALFQISNSTNIPCSIIKGICDWGVAKNNICRNPKYEDKIKNGLQAYAMLNVLDRCWVLFSDSTLFDMPKSNEFQHLIVSIKKKNICLILSVIAIVINIGIDFINMGREFIDYKFIIKPFVLKILIYLVCLISIFIINSNVLNKISKKKKLMKAKLLKKQNKL